MQSQDTMTLRRALTTVYRTENGNRLQSPAVEFEFCIKRMALWQFIVHLPPQQCELRRFVVSSSLQLRISIYVTIKFKLESKFGLKI